MKKLFIVLFLLVPFYSFAAPHSSHHVIQSERQLRGDSLSRFSPEISVSFMIEEGFTEFEISRQIKDAIISHADTTLKNIICGTSSEESDGFKAIIAEIFKQRKIPIYDVKVNYTCRNSKE